MYSDVKYLPGTNKIPQLTSLQSQTFDETNHVHFPDNILRTIPRWVDANLIRYDFLGACRTIYAAYTDGYYYFFGTSERLYVAKNGTLYNITPVQTSSTAAANSLSTVDTTNVVTLTKAAHGLQSGDRVKISGSATTNGIPDTQINAEHIITVATANTFTFETASNATSTGGSGGGASTVYYPPIDGGFIDMSLGEGYGGGLYGVGLYGVSKTFTNTFRYPRIWSIDRFGNDFVMCVGDYTTNSTDSVYFWDGDTDVAPVLLANAPTDTGWVYQSANAVVALSNARVSVSEIGDATVWTPGIGTTAYFDDVEGVNRLIAGIRGRGTDLLFSEDGVLTFTFIGEPNYWRAADLMTSDGLIAPRAAVNAEETIYWMGKRGFYSFDGSTVRRLDNPLNEDWIFSNLNQAQRWKTFCRVDIENHQIYWFFPVGNEPDNYVIYNYQHGHWTLGTRNLTAAQIPSPVNGTFYTANNTGLLGEQLFSVSGVPLADSGGNLLYAADPNDQVIWLDDQTTGEPLQALARTSYAYASPQLARMRINEIIPDSYAESNYNMRILTREWAQSTAVPSIYYEVTPTQEYISTDAAGKLRAIEWSSTDNLTVGAWRENIILQGKT